MFAHDRDRWARILVLPAVRRLEFDDLNLAWMLVSRESKSEARVFEDDGLPDSLCSITQNLTEHLTNRPGHADSKGNLQPFDLASSFSTGVLVTLPHQWR